MESTTPLSSSSLTVLGGLVKAHLTGENPIDTTLSMIVPGIVVPDDKYLAMRYVAISLAGESVMNIL